VDCECALESDGCCVACGRAYGEHDGIWHAINPLTGRNKIAAAFYDGPGWERFRPWERLFLNFQGGEAHARRSILRHMPRQLTATVLEVGIGEGENLRLLPKSWNVYGVDIARNRLAACRDRFPHMSGRLIWAEAEALPFMESTFDAVFSIGGFNFFRDPAKALREMRRVARPGSTLIIADEIPGLHRFAPGRILGFDEIDRWCLQRMGLTRDFVEMALSCRLDPNAIAALEWPGHRRVSIWNRLGYCLVASMPAADGSRAKRDAVVA
jgi:SAM-dependent methyltransferase